MAAAGWVNARIAVHGDEQLAQTARDGQRRQALTDRASAYLAASYHGVLSLRDLALAAPDVKPGLDKQFVWPVVDRVNTALLAIQINDPADLVRAVESVDAAMDILADEAKEKVFTHEAWRARRLEIVGELPSAVVKVARDHTLRLQSVSDG